MSQEAIGVVVGALAEAEAKGSLEQGVLLVRKASRGDLSLLQPGLEGVGRGDHGSPSSYGPED